MALSPFYSLVPSFFVVTIFQTRPGGLVPIIMGYQGSLCPTINNPVLDGRAMD
jgi:hypothetical protein